MPENVVSSLLSKAVGALGGQERSGQVAMAEAVGAAFESGRHLMVQAGTGTGKSLAYLVPSLMHDKRVVVATATLALQHQLVERDLPRLIEATADVSGLDRSFAVLKGRGNYACLHRIREGVPDDAGTLSMDIPMGDMAKKVLELRSWAEEQVTERGSGDRDSAPRHSDREWRQVSVSSRDCIGAGKCPFAGECFAEKAKEAAQKAHIVVTNHTLLAIDAIEGIPMIPEYDAVVVDEAHELVARITQAATSELAANDVDRAARRARRHVAGSEADDLSDAAEALKNAILDQKAGRLETLPQELSDALELVRDAARTCASAMPKDSDDAALTQAKGMLNDVFTIAERMAADGRNDVLWISEGTDRIPPRLVSAPLDVSLQVRDRLLADKAVVLTSATLKLGGDFVPVAANLGLPAGSYEALDVGSPFDYPKQGILYVARHLPPPGRDGLGPAQLDEIAELVDAADGRALGLFSSRRAADAAAEALRTRLPHLTILAQGDAQLPELTAQFISDPHTVLCGTLSLWQGLDVPGDTCQLVIIDRIPFPRPDDPLMSARQKAADDRGGNGFMQVAATHAALLLAQGSGRLIRTHADKGVVAILDPRLATARYGGFLKASLPPLWPTTDPAAVRAALKRLSAMAIA